MASLGHGWGKFVVLGGIGYFGIVQLLGASLDFGRRFYASPLITALAVRTSSAVPIQSNH